MNFRRFITSIFLSLILFSSASAATRVGGDEEQQSPVKSFFDLASEQLLSNAKKYIGRPYRIGSTGPRAFDCSGFTSYVFRHFGYNITKFSVAQFSEGREVPSFTDIQKGDLVFFGKRDSVRDIGHVGIVVSIDRERGSFRFIHASVSRGVTEDDANHPYFMMRYMGARRILPDE